VPVAENDTESITPERLEKATEIIETAELGEFEADIRGKVAAIDKEHEEEEEIATLLEEEKIIEEVLHTFSCFELDEESEPNPKAGRLKFRLKIC
jgi:hypothetical protein